MSKINLLPPEQKKRVKTMMLFQNIIFSGMILIVFLLIIILFIASILVFINFKASSIEKEIIKKQLDISQNETLRGAEKKINELNNKLAGLRLLQKERSSLNSILDDLSQNLLLNVRIYNLNINQEERKIDITGFSATRENLLNIKKLLENSTQYRITDFPLSNLTNAKDIEFRFSIVYEN